MPEGLEDEKDQTCKSAQRSTAIGQRGEGGGGNRESAEGPLRTAQRH